MDPDRRAFIGVAAGLAVTAVLPSCASIAVLPVMPSDGMVRLSLSSHPRLLEPGGHVRLRRTDDGAQIDVLALGGGAFAALSPICTHRGCTVNVAGAHLLCPCHGSAYDREGRVLRGPAERALRRFQISATPEGELVIRVEEGR
ncbi:MAG: ubiquinol-cytochrome c reductase iron-sulfur subunit [Gemmatimonadota bacterium]